MRLISVFLITLFVVTSCGSDTKKEDDSSKKDVLDSLAAEEDTLADITIVSDYDMSTVNKKDQREFKENLVKIEKKYGEQWDFCMCAIKRDSINKAFQKPNMSDEEFDKVYARSDEIDLKCQAFSVQNPNVTPEERDEHERKIRKCLKEAGIKY